MNPTRLLLTAALAGLSSAAIAAAPLPPLPKPEATEQWEPKVPVVSVPRSGIPSDAIVLFDGSDLSQWESTDSKNPAPRWTLEPENRAVVVAPNTGGLRTKAAFGDIQLHLEWRSPSVVKKSGQGRGNSGILFMGGRYELQILDSYDNETYPNGQAGSLYKQFPPNVNACRAPGEWQTYDVIFIAPRFNADNSLASPARLTAFHNGVLIQHDTALRGPTVYRGVAHYAAHPDKLPFILQNHGGDLVAFRNIWVRELSFPPPPPLPNVPPPPYAPEKKK